MSSQPSTILFVCTGNSCRSQMAEGWARLLGGAKVHVASAGIVASGLNPLAVQVMREAGIDISRQISKEVTPRLIHAADIVVTVCANADRQCPSIPKEKLKFHWPIYDPVSFDGDAPSQLAMFRVVRDEIRDHIVTLFTEHKLLDESALTRIRKVPRG